VVSLQIGKAVDAARVDDRLVINGILWRFRTGAPWRDVPERYGRAQPSMRYETAA